MLDEASGVTDWRLHDLRRSAASNVQDLGIRNEVVQAVLNHAVCPVLAASICDPNSKSKRQRRWRSGRWR